MVWSGEIILSLYGIAVFAVLRRSHLRRKQKQIPSKDIISEQIPRKDMISGQIPSKDMISGQIRTKDRISELPDDILISIISRMRNKDSIRTSILSKRWRNLYKVVPDIEFRCCDLLVDCSCCSYDSQYDSNLIYKIVDRFFRLRSGSDKIRSFSLRCRLNKPYTDRFEAWMHSLGRMGVEDLLLQFRSSDISFSCSLIYEMPSLRSLKLASCSLQPPMGKTQLCKSLQSLILRCVRVAPGALDCILSTCLSLQTLSFDYCHFEPATKLSFSGPNLQLKSLYIVNSGDIESIRLCASNLTTFEFDSHLVSFIFDHVPRLQSMHLVAFGRNILPFVFGELAHLPQLKSLSFHTATYLWKMYDRPVGINMFRNLRQLDFGFHWTVDMNLLSLIPFLQSCPLLQEFHLDMTRLTYAGPQVEKQAIVLHSELKKVELSGFHGTQNEMEFALYMLKSAVGLELMHISRGWKYYMGYGSWHYDDESKWSCWTHRMIRRQLQGQAVSKTARLVIQFESLYEEDKWGRSDGYYDVTTLRSDYKYIIVTPRKFEVAKFLRAIVPL